MGVIKGSVKDLLIEKKPTTSSTGEGKFVFTDDYSVFDWGKMPDPIEKKGKTLCMMGAFNLELLENKGIKTHYQGLIENGKVKTFHEISEPTNEMKVMLVQKPKLEFKEGEYRYDLFKEKLGNNYLVPLEIIFRNAIPKGSSFRKRFSPSKVGLEREEWPDENIELSKPIIDFSTKLETKDRYLSKKEAFEVSCLSRKEFNELTETAKKVNALITEQAEKQGMKHEDGKIEVVYSGGELFVADVVGTFDENRFSFNGKEISKEVIRQYYKRKQPEWITALGKAKKTAAQNKKDNWKEFCEIKPKKLPAELLNLLSEMYCAGANQYTDKRIFETRPLGKVLDEVYSWS